MSFLTSNLINLYFVSYDAVISVVLFSVISVLLSISL